MTWRINNLLDSVGSLKHPMISAQTNAHSYCYFIQSLSKTNGNFYAFCKTYGQYTRLRYQDYISVKKLKNSASVVLHQKRILLCSWVKQSFSTWVQHSNKFQNWVVRQTVNLGRSSRHKALSLGLMQTVYILNSRMFWYYNWLTTVVSDAETARAVRVWDLNCTPSAMLPSAW